MNDVIKFVKNPIFKHKFFITLGVFFACFLISILIGITNEPAGIHSVHYISNYTTYSITSSFERGSIESMLFIALNNIILVTCLFTLAVICSEILAYIMFGIQGTALGFFIGGIIVMYGYSPAITGIFLHGMIEIPTYAFIIAAGSVLSEKEFGKMPQGESFNIYGIFKTLIKDLKYIFKTMTEPVKLKILGIAIILLIIAACIETWIYPIIVQLL